VRAMLMRKRKWLILSLLLAACFGVAYLCFAPRRGVTLANFERIEKGMTQEQVEDFLGGPPGLPYRVGEIDATWVFENYELMIGHNFRVWQSREGSLGIYFDEVGKVAVKTWFPYEESFWDRFRRWLRL
jgi:hypothetical protein